jgi:hypothetical protein
VVDGIDLRETVGFNPTAMIYILKTPELILNLEIDGLPSWRKNK